MARKNVGLADDLVQLVSGLPWQVGIVLAIATYFLFHHFAATPAHGVVPPAQMGQYVVGTMAASLSRILQWVVPLVCLVASGVSAIKRTKRKTLAADTAQAKSTDAFSGMSWQKFEQLVGESFRQRGYAVKEIGGGGADGGVDLVLSKAGEKFLVQSKQWRAQRVGVDVVRELYGVMAAQGATGGFVVTSGRFTAEATEFASGRNVKLIDGPQLFQMLGGTAAPKAASSAAAATPARAPATTPACPVCGSPMVKRTARKGSNAGSTFWGCSTYPKCKGTVAP